MRIALLAGTIGLLIGLQLGRISYERQEQIINMLQAADRSNLADNNALRGENVKLMAAIEKLKAANDNLVAGDNALIAADARLKAAAQRLFKACGGEGPRP